MSNRTNPINITRISNGYTISPDYYGEAEYRVYAADWAAVLKWLADNEIELKSQDAEDVGTALTVIPA